MDIIQNRFSIRKFKPIPVEAEKITALLHAAMCAPTACNYREWEFMVITDPDILESLSKVSPYSSPAAKAPLVIVPIFDHKNVKLPDFVAQDMGACSENILLQAVKEGLGGVWLGIYPLQERMAAVSAILHLPENYSPFALLAIGYADETGKVRDRFDEKKIHFNRF